MRLTPICLIGIALQLPACGPAPLDSGTAIEALLERAEQAAEAGDADALAAMLDADFRDGYGRNRRATTFMLRSLIGRYSRMEIVTRDVEIEILSPRLANAELTFIAVARDGSRPLLTGFDADRQRLRVALRADGDDWLVSRAEWSSAAAD